jgi:citrate lyase subunit beta / citryl-CoA lyase
VGVTVPLPARTWLFVPAHRGSLVSKALASPADVVVLDLEDSVPPAEKTAARAGVVEALDAPPDRAVLVRVNTDTLPQDLEVAFRPGVAGVMIPKATAALVVAADRLLRYRSDFTIVVLIEDPDALDAVPAMRAASMRVRQAAFGALDFAASVGLAPEAGAESLDHARQHLVLSSHRAGLLPPVDSPVTTLGDTSMVSRRARRARALGFQGMLLIHPEQINPVVEAFQPTELEVEQARRVVQLYDNAYRNGIGAVRVDGMMIDAANIGTYRRLLAEARR